MGVNMFEEHRDECPEEADGQSHLYIAIDFDLDENDTVTSASLESHTHYVPPIEAAAALMSAALQTLRESVNPDAGDDIPEFMRGPVVEMFIQQSFMNLAEKVAKNQGTTMVEVEQDASSLFDQ